MPTQSLDQIFAQPAQKPSLDSIFSGGASDFVGQANLKENKPGVLKSIAGQYQQAGQNIATDVQEGANIAARGGVGNLVRGGLEGGLSAAGNVANAAFAPVGAVAQKLVPGDGLLSRVGQGAVAGTVLAGNPVAGGLFGGALWGIEALKGQLKKVPAVERFLAKNPDVEKDFDNALSIGLAALGEKKAGETPKGPGGDLMHAPVSEVPRMAVENISNVVKPLATTAGQGLRELKTKGVDTLGMGKEVVAKLTGRGAPNPENVDQFIIDKYNKAIRPSVSGKSSGPQIDSQNQRVVTGVKTILANEPNLTYTNADGEVSSARTPQTPKEMSDAISQTKEKVFGEYNAQTQRATGKGLMVDLKTTAAELNKIASDPVLQDHNPNAASYAASKAEILNQRGEYTPSQNEQAIKLYNKSLEAFYQNPSYETASRVAIDAFVVKQMRAAQDVLLEQNGDPGYQDLKNQYGALRSMEKDVAHRAVVSGRAAPNSLFSSLGDVASATELIRGLVTMNPTAIAGSVAIKGVKAYLQWLNNPDTLIKTMFDGVKKSTGTSGQKTSSSPRTKAVSRGRATREIT